MGPTSIYRPFRQTSNHHSGSFGCLFIDLSSSTGSTSRHLHQDSPRTTFYPYPPGHHFFIPHPSTHAHVQNYQINARMFDSLQILFTLGIWLFCVQVLDHHLFTSFLQVYTQHWHVVSPAVLHLHSQSHPLILAFRIPFSGSAVLTPPFAFLVLVPVSFLTHMSRLIYKHLLTLLTLMLFFVTL